MRSVGKRKSLNTSIFHIRLGNHVQKIDLKDPVFLRILEQQYAARYLESMGVETTAKNIAKILKERPLESCDIVQSRLTGGLHTDTITVITKTQASSTLKSEESQTISNEMLKILDLKKMALKKDSKQLQNKKLKQAAKNAEQESTEKQTLQNLDFSIKSIKSRYIFPFNENFTRKNNYKMKDLSNLLEGVREEESKMIFEAGIFRFPFTQIKLTLNTLKQLQIPIATKLSDILNFLEGYYQQFPKAIFPVDSAQKGLKKEVHVSFDKSSIDRMFEIIRSEENAKFIGVFLHLSYWSIFGGVNPIQIDKSMKRKMFLMISETIEYFELKTQNKKTWENLVQPMIILTLKMSLDYFYHLQYPKLFLSEQTMKTGGHEIAFDKILLFVDKILDQGCINARFIFLESDIDGPKGNFTKDKRFIRKRIFGTSPGLQMILPDPKDGKARSIMAKNTQIDQKEGTLDENCNISHHREEDQECRQKLLNLALLKIRSRIEQITGSNSGNPIIKLEDKD